jgi:hypothetical protein
MGIDPSNSAQFYPTFSQPSNLDPLDTQNKIFNAYAKLSESTLSEAVKTTGFEHTVPKPTTFQLAMPGTENIGKSIDPKTQEGLNAMAILFAIIAAIESMQRDTGTKTAIASTQMLNTNMEMQVSAANADYNTQMKAAQATIDQAKIDGIMGAIGIAVGVLSIVAAFCPAAAVEKAGAKAGEAAGEAAGETAIEMTTLAENAGSAGTKAVATGAEVATEAASAVGKTVLQAAESASEESVSVVSKISKTASKAWGKLGELKNIIKKGAEEAYNTKGFWKTVVTALPQALQGAGNIIKGNQEQTMIAADQQLQGAYKALADVLHAQAQFFQQQSSQYTSVQESAQKTQDQANQAEQDVLNARSHYFG